MILVTGAVREEDIMFSATGHNHAGATNGQQLDVDLAFIDFVHNHSAAAEGGVLGLNALKVDEQSAANGSAVTLGATDTQVVALSSMTVAVGDRILLFAMIRPNYVVGQTAIRAAINKLSGTATLSFLNSAAEIRAINSVTASVAHYVVVAGEANVTGAGTLVMQLVGISDGANADIPIGFGQLYALVLRGAA